jgi:hypothetical protein
MTKGECVTSVKMLYYLWLQKTAIWHFSGWLWDDIIPCHSSAWWRLLMQVGVILGITIFSCMISWIVCFYFTIKLWTVQYCCRNGLCYTLVSKVNDFQCVDCSSSLSSAMSLEHIQPAVLRVASFVRQYCLCIVLLWQLICESNDKDCK